MTVLELLEESRQIVADPFQWCQNCPAQDSNGKEVTPWDDRATHWCGVGVLRRGHVPTEVGNAAAHALLEAAQLTHRYHSAEWVNDTLGQEAMLRVYDLAIERAKAG